MNVRIRLNAMNLIILPRCYITLTFITIYLDNKQGKHLNKGSLKEEQLIIIKLI